MIRHISFDAWNTLLKPNKRYSSERTRLISEILRISPEEAARMYTEVKRKADAAAETHGQSFLTNDLWVDLAGDMTLAMQLKNSCVVEFIKNPPHIPAHVRNVVSQLKHRQFTLSVTSNTNMISGEVLQPMLEAAFVDAFSFMYFSDQLPVAKPHQALFHMVVRQAQTLHSTPLDRSEVMHVGDHQLCDVDGAHRAGLYTQLVHVDTLNITDFPMRGAL